MHPNKIMCTGLWRTLKFCWKYSVTMQLLIFKYRMTKYPSFCYRSMCRLYDNQAQVAFDQSGGHVMYSDDVAKLAVIIADVYTFCWNLVICLQLEMTLLVENLVKIWHCLPELWKCVQGFIVYSVLHSQKTSYWGGSGVDFARFSLPENCTENAKIAQNLWEELCKSCGRVLAYSR